MIEGWLDRVTGIDALRWQSFASAVSPAEAGWAAFGWHDRMPSGVQLGQRFEKRVRAVPLGSDVDNAK